MRPPGGLRAPPGFVVCYGEFCLYQRGFTIMKRIRSWGLAVVVLMLVFGLALAIQAQSPLQIAAVQNGAPVLADTSGAIQPLPVPPGRDIFAIAWSPDGQRLALVVNDESYTPQLFVTSPDMAEMIALDAGPLESGFGAAFTPDGQILYAAQGVFPADFSAPPMVEIRQIAPEAGAQPVTLGQFTYVVGCGGGSPIPADWQLWAESGFGGSYLSLQWTPLGIVHSTACSGGSASILDLATGEDRPLGPTFDQQDMTAGGPISRLVVSPDGQQAAGIRFRYEGAQALTSLVLIDLATGAITDVAMAEQPDQLAWSTDSAVYYSTRTPSRDVAAAYDGKDRATLAAALGYATPDEMTPLNAYAAGIRRVDLATGADELLQTLDAYAVGRMRQAADGTLIFSTIANLDAWAQAIVSGAYDPVADTTGDQARALVPVSVYQLAPGSTEAQLLGANLESFELRPDQAAG